MCGADDGDAPVAADAAATLALLDAEELSSSHWADGWPAGQRGPPLSASSRRFLSWLGLIEPT